MFHCISTVCLNCFNLKESSFCILSFKTEEVSMPAILLFASFYFFHIEFIFAANMQIFYFAYIA